MFLGRHPWLISKLYLETYVCLFPSLVVHCKYRHTRIPAQNTMSLEMSSIAIPNLATKSYWLMISFEKSLHNRHNSEVSVQMSFSSSSSALSPGRLGVYKYDNDRDNSALADQFAVMVLVMPLNWNCRNWTISLVLSKVCAGLMGKPSILKGYQECIEK